MLRYKLNPDELRIVIIDDEGTKKKTIYPSGRHQNIFVDILDKKPGFIKIRVFYQDEIIVGWVTSQISDLIVIHNESEVYDGRFNSDKIEDIVA